MKTIYAYAASLVGVLFGLASLDRVNAQTASMPPQARSTIAQSLTPPALSQARVDESLIEFPLPKGEQSYGSIDGRKLHQYVVDLAQIALRYRDAGHPQFWGRLIGTSSELETDHWLAGKFTSFGLSDVRIQKLDLPPQWMPQSWSVSMSGGGKSIRLTSAQPAYYANGLPKGGVELDAVYAGLGTEADFMGKDVRGKAVFVYGMLGLPDEGAERAVRRADAKGAAVVFAVSMLPGNMHYEAYPSSTKAPCLYLGNDDGTAARQMIESMPAAAAPKVKVTLDVQKVPNLKSELVWGTLPGATDETIYITAHKDGWFQSASDNAGGVASMLGLAEYYAKIPRAQRRRTMIFIGLDGHHNEGQRGMVTGGAGRRWIAEHRSTLFAKTALVINDEHPATLQTQSRPRYYPGDEIAWSNTPMPLQWYAGGTTRPELQKIAWDAFKEFGVPVELDPSPTPPASDMSYFFKFVPGVDASEYHNYFHTDWETPEVVPWTGLEATTRAFAKIIDEVNKHPLSAFQRPEDTSPGPYDE
jgi:Peptidase family M28